jgi:hypothetical protein
VVYAHRDEISMLTATRGFSPQLVLLINRVLFGIDLCRSTAVTISSVLTSSLLTILLSLLELLIRPRARYSVAVVVFLSITPRCRGGNAYGHITSPSLLRFLTSLLPLTKFFIATKLQRFAKSQLKLSVLSVPRLVQFCVVESTTRFSIDLT